MLSLLSSFLFHVLLNRLPQEKGAVKITIFYPLFRYFSSVKGLPEHQIEYDKR